MRNIVDKCTGMYGTIPMMLCSFVPKSQESRFFWYYLHFLSDSDYNEIKQVDSEMNEKLNQALPPIKQYTAVYFLQCRSYFLIFKESLRIIIILYLNQIRKKCQVFACNCILRLRYIESVVQTSEYMCIICSSMSDKKETLLTLLMVTKTNQYMINIF